jgi:deoxyribonuclease-4
MGVKSKNSGVVIHMGKNTEKNPVEKCFENFVNSIIKILEKTESLKANIILETSCKSDNDLFFRIEQLGKLYKQIPENYRKRVKFCIDTCHVFVSGYDISTLEGVKDFFALFNKEIGLENIVLIHLNDSKVSLGKGTDRHEMIGKGFIFKDNNRSLKEIFRVSKKLKIPMISETHADIEQEIEIIKSI